MRLTLIQLKKIIRTQLSEQLSSLSGNQQHRPAQLADLHQIVKEEYKKFRQSINQEKDTKDTTNKKQLRQTLKGFVEKDQALSDEPPARKALQDEVWPFIQNNIEAILSDVGHGDGDFPAAPYSAWVLVQHMDAFPENQIKFIQQLENSKLTVGGKLQFLKDRAAVNQWILQHANNPLYFYKGKDGKKKVPIALPDPAVNVRNPKYFSDAGEDAGATSRDQALDNARTAGNLLLVAAVEATGAQTQPSYLVSTP